MTISELIDQIDDKQPSPSEAELTAFESAIGGRLPEDYRQFLQATNGGTVEDDALCFVDPTPGADEASFCVLCIGGLRDELHLSLTANRDTYQISESRIPRDLIWIMEDSFGNAACIGVKAEARGKIYRWNHEDESVRPLANSFTEFVGGLRPPRTNSPEAADDRLALLGCRAV
jgi:hypothetical protein